MSGINIKSANIEDAAMIAQHDKRVAFSILHDKIEHILPVTYRRWISKSIGWYKK